MNHNAASEGRSFLANTAFTLIELLVSISILVLLILLVTQMVNSAESIVNGSRKHTAADTGAREVLDRISSDIATMVKRKDLNYIFYKGSGNDAMFFYGKGPASTSGSSDITSGISTTSLIGYRIYSSSTLHRNVPVLERMGKALTWDDIAYVPSYSASPMLSEVYGTLIGSSSGSYSDGTDDLNYYHVISSDIFRMEICFLVKSGTYSLSGSTYTCGTTGYSNSPNGVSNSFSDGNLNGLPPNLTGIVVTVAVLDDASRKMLSNQQTALTTIAAQLNDSQEGSTPADAWQSTLSNFTNFTGIPKGVLSNVRIYQRTTFITN
jgi:hypothetical protein